MKNKTTIGIFSFIFSTLGFILAILSIPKLSILNIKIFFVPIVLLCSIGIILWIIDISGSSSLKKKIENNREDINKLIDNLK